MIRTVAPKSWTMDRALDVADRTARYILEMSELDEDLKHARGCEHNEARRRLEEIARAEKLAAAWRNGERFSMVSDAVRELEPEAEGRP